MLLDDPLSAVDAHVGKQLWNNVIVNYLHRHGKTVIIASHQTQYFAQCDRVIVLKDGEIEHFCPVNELTGLGLVNIKTEQAH